MVLLEDRLKFLFGDADSGVQDLDAQRSCAPAAADQNFAALGVLQRVRKQVADHLLEQARSGVYRKAARDHAQVKSLRLRMIGELVPQPLQQTVDREIDHLGADGAGFDLVDVEQRVQHARYCA